MALFWEAFWGQAKKVKIELPCTRELDFEGPESLGMRLLSDSLLRVFPGPPFLRPTFAKDDTITKISSKWYSKRCTWGVWILCHLSLPGSQEHSVFGAQRRSREATIAAKGSQMDENDAPRV